MMRAAIAWLRANIILSLLSFLFALVILAIFVMFSENVACAVNRLLGTDKKKETLQFIGFAISGAAVFIAAAVLNKRADAQLENNRIGHESNQIEQFKNAVNHLEKGSTRLAAFYQLESIARLQKEKREDIFQILCGYLRKVTTEPEYQYIGEKIERNEPSEEVQSLIDLLFKRKNSPFDGLKADLRRLNLIGINLGNAQLQGADMRFARLQRAILQDAKVQGAYLNSAELQGARLSGAKLQGADLSGAKLQGAYLNSAELQGADLSGAKLQGADLSFGKLQEADLSGAKLQGADLSFGELQGADLDSAELQGADLNSTELQGASLIGAELQGADLDNAELQGADLNSTELQGADLRDIYLQGASSSLEMGVSIFSQRINHYCGKEAELEGVTYKGGITQEQLKQWHSDLKSIAGTEIANQFYNLLEEHIGQERQSLAQCLGELKDENIATGSYSQEDADKWILEYEEATENIYN